MSKATSKLRRLLRRKDARLFAGYVLFAGIATVVDVGLLYALTSIAGVHYLLSNIISYACGMLTNYTLNKLYNFRNKSKRVAAQFSLFAFVALIGLGLNQLLLWMLVEFAQLWYLFAKLVAIMVVMLWSFYGHKKLAFGVIR